MKILVINGSLGGANGNTAKLLEFISPEFTHAEVSLVHLAERRADLREKIQAADAFLFLSGTYWDSWGSPLQEFLETMTDTEGSELWLGKPAAVLVTMHSVGGKSVLSRLQGVLNTFGCLIPPMSGMVYSLANHLALQSESSFADDLWQTADLKVIAHNLQQSLSDKPNWRAWAVDHADPQRVWFNGPV